MKLRGDQLAANLAKGLVPVYLISGDEPLQMQELADAVRARAREQGFQDRQIFHAERSFDWSQLAQAGDSLSLFAERRILDLRLAGKPGDAGSKALIAYTQRLPDDTVLLVTCPKLDKKAAQGKWVRALERAGVMVQVWPLGNDALPGWIQTRMRSRGLQASREAVAMLADRVEGNLLAAAQEIDKLLLLHGPGRVDVETVAAVVADSSRFDVFGLVDSALAGQAGRAARMLQALRNEGVAAPLVSWALGREVRALSAMAAELTRGARVEAVFGAHRVWDRRKPVLRAALRRNGLEQWYELLERCGRAERVAKGAEMGNPWEELLQLILSLAGIRSLPARTNAREMESTTAAG